MSAEVSKEISRGIIRYAPGSGAFPRMTQPPSMVRMRIARTP